MPTLPAASLVDVDGHAVEFVRAGTGVPTVVLINGSGGPLAGWMRVFDGIAARTTTLSYNRLGVGRSARPATAQTAAEMVASLRRLLAALQLAPPYVLVGHSFGGLVANLYARLHPADVVGVVLLEATAPQDLTALKAHENALQKGLAWLMRRLAPPQRWHETEHTARSAADLAAAPPFPAVPLRVVTGTKPAMAWATKPALLQARATHQRGLVALSPLGRQVLADSSGHFPQLSEPERVVKAVLELVDAGQRVLAPAS
ncbi:alpha/beta hydrolase [Roseateles asaccharophilus]|uniref:Pimeloyl-ACP methyl ester carboxylesterase n=1 Tax=Roseateles asaccharophilus TaxID=582607 RepID=A0ABU2A6I6_9BURK|nr:alpha/beta hydrolase [Roseateles asaccharophilus]MDR7332819.1 pimeloyl-ACP methyl ester carboxylesterase [Roseateles asaccharophilus]